MENLMSDNVTSLAVVPAPDAMVLNTQDQTFLQQAQQSNLTEIAEADAALKNTSNITSREFARWMIGDHGGQAQQLTAIAQQLGVTLPTSLDTSHQAEVAQLSSLTGPAFDQAYAQGGVQDHAQTIAAFQQEIASGSNPTLIALAQQGLPLLQAHLAQSSILAANPVQGVLTLPPAPPVGAAAGTLSTQDQTFVAQAASSSLAEIAEGQVAEQQSDIPSSEFGRWMVTDHSAMSVSLAAIGQQEGFIPTTTLTPNEQAGLSRLQGASPGDFESVYSSSQVLDHAKTLMQFVQEANSGSDPALVAFAQSGVQVLTQHLAGAVELALNANGITPPTGDDLGNALTSLAQNNGGLFQTLLADITGTLPQPGNTLPTQLGNLYAASDSHPAGGLMGLLHT
jgi:putative membrane protein